MGLGHSPSIVVDGLVFMIDPNNTNCYSGSGNTVYNLVNPSIGGTFVGYTSNPIDNTENRTIAFDGTNNYLDFGSSSIFKLTDNFTISCWVKSSVYGDRAILGNFGPSSNYSGFNLNIQPSGKFAFLTGSQPNATYLYADNTYNLNTWYHVTGLRRNGTNYLYINGVLQSSTNTQVVASSAQNFYLARWYSNLTGYYHYGNIGIVSLYNKALSSDEILQNYNATKKKYDPDENIVTNGLVLNIDPSKNTSYPGTGNTIYDLSGSGNTGTLVNSPSFSSLNGGQINMPGSSKYIDLGQKFNFTSENFSVSCWIYLDSFNTISNAGQGPIPFFKGDFQQMGYYSQIDSNGSFGISTNQGGARQSSSTSAGILTTSAWNNLSCVRNGSSIRIYINGIDKTSAAGTHINPSSSNQTFKINYYKGDYLISGQMRISQFLIYNRALTQQEIQQNYNATKNRFINALPAVRNGLVLELDAGQRSSYSGAGNTWYDLSGNSFNGTLTNGPTFSGIGATSSIVFDGSNDYISVPTTLSVNASEFSYEVLFKITTAADGNTLLSLNYTYPSSGYLVRQTTGNYLIIYSDNGTETSLSSNSALSNNTIYHIVIVQNNNNCSIYINGILDKSASLSNPVLTSSNENFLGRRGAPSYGANLLGSISVSKIYNRALSAYEVKQNFDFYRTRYNI